MDLGGNITLEGFDSIEPAKLIVIKKIAGSFAKKVNETKGEYERIIFRLENSYKINIKIKQDNNEIDAENTDKNLFFALTNAIKSIESKI